MSDISVFSRQQRIVANPAAQTVSVLSIGSPGPPGPTGLVPVFASAAARNAAITSPTEGMVVTTIDTDQLWMYANGAWVPIGGGGAWTNYVPTFDADNASAVSVGSGGSADRAGRYTQIGKTVICQVNIRFGTTGTQFGTGMYQIGLPVANSLVVTGGAPKFRPGQGGLYVSTDAGIIHEAQAECQIVANKMYLRLVNGTGAAVVTFNSPFAFANGAYISGQVIYEAA